MNLLDWTVLSLYVLIIIGIGLQLSRSQYNQEDYYLGGKKIPSWQIALSMVATQVSAISLIGAPAFIAMRKGGGLFWLQYEFAIPIAMIFIMITMVPIYHRFGVVSIYEYLEERFGPNIRTVLSLIFMTSRSLAAGVALVATSIVTSVILDIPLPITVIIIGAIAILYTTMGGIKADIYSDILQLIILWFSAIVCLFVLMELIKGVPFPETERYRIFRMSGTGLGDGKIYGFWPMLLGGFFLYLSYYGCDQSETQRLLTAKDAKDAQKALLINGMLRFPLVITYCSVGILMIPFLLHHPGFMEIIKDKQPDFLMPQFLIHYMPHGLLGLAIAGIFAASMSSLDSTLNSLSAVTWRDFLQKYSRFQGISPKKELWFSKLLTLGWGVLCTIFALYMIGGPETVLVMVNKIGSAFYGPILAMFWLGIFTKRANEKGAVTGLILGVGLNIFLWRFYEHRVSWLWWNLIGFATSFAVGYVVSMILSASESKDNISIILASRPPFYYVISLVFAFCAILTACWLIQYFLC